MTVLPTALAFARHGHAVLPLNWPVDHGGKLLCSCGGDSRGKPCGRNAAKHPYGKLVSNGLLGATCELGVIKHWFGYQVPDANLGVRTDKLIVVDADPRHGGDETVAALIREHGEFPPTWQVLTGGGGLHVIFACPEGAEVASFTAATNPKLGAGIDVRARGGYIVAPSSRHINGRHYEWSVDHHPKNVPLALPPEWMLERLTASKAALSDDGAAEPLPSDAWAKLTWQPISEYRDMAATQIAGHLFCHAWLGGLQGIGKDTLLEPVKRAVGPWNVAEVSPQHLLGRFNAFLKSVILRISEARDLGEFDRFKFYDHLKAYTAAPPDVLRVDEKNLREYNVPNCCGIILTTNHKADGIFLPADDRRHFVAWSNLDKDDFSEAYWNELWCWYNRGGDRHVATYLAELDISGFHAKRPPPKTAAFWDIVDASRAPEDAELADVLDELFGPDAVTLARVQDKATGEFQQWLKDRKNRRQIPYRFEQCGYVPVRNDAAADGLWSINGRRQVIYAKDSLSLHDRLAAAALLARWH